jgi:hypothetical protein
MFANGKEIIQLDVVTGDMALPAAQTSGATPQGPTPPKKQRKRKVYQEDEGEE